MTLRDRDNGNELMRSFFEVVNSAVVQSPPGGAWDAKGRRDGKG